MIHQLLQYMQRIAAARIAATITACLLALYGAAAALASDAPAQSGTVAATAQVPHIALLLPVNSKIFGRHATALRDGFRAAAKNPGKTSLPVREYAVSEDVAGVLEAYRAAVAAGAQIVVGPLTRDAVTALAFGEPVPVPTLALNVPDNTGRNPGNLYLLSLQIETEARQVARIAWRDGRRNAVTLNGGSPVERRMQAAFAGEFMRLGGRVITDIAYTPDPERLKAITRGGGAADMYFLALGYAEARIVRPYLGATPVYATSGVHAGDQGPLAGFDLAGVNFVDMPWLLEPNHAAVMVYARPKALASMDLERFYALGIDAWRIAQLLLSGARDIRLDGVTGQLTLGADGYIERELVSGRYSEGRPQATDPAPREPAR
ncbi:MAG: penicillin-binding protein activator [Burkholderiales bacterium]|nr:penicillin-binding protein activator [Burkholderiales bacterium]